MVVHVLANRPKNGQPNGTPLVGLCGEAIAGLYVRRADRSPANVCAECRAALARNSQRPARPEDGTDEEAASG